MFRGSSRSPRLRSRSPAYRPRNPDDEYTVTVHTLGGTSFTVPHDAGGSVWSLKETIQQVRGIPRRQQRLVLGTEILEDDRELTKENNAVTLLLRSPEALAWLSQRPPDRLLGAAPEEIRGDRRQVIKSLRMHWHGLRHAAPHLKADPEVVLTSLRRWRDSFGSYRGFRSVEQLQATSPLRFADPRLLRDPAFMLRAVRVDGASLGFAAPGTANNPEVALAALRQEPLAEVYLTEALRREIYDYYAARQRAPY